MLGLFIYIIVFAICIPLLLYKFKFYNLLDVYYPNLDIIATIVSFNSGFKNTIFDNLYNTRLSEEEIYSPSEIVINYISLLGLIFIVLRYSKGNIIKGISRASVMLLITYLLPNQIIDVVLNYIYETYNLPRMVVVCIGFVLMFFVLLLEFVVFNFASVEIAKFIKFIIYTLPKKL